MNNSNPFNPAFQPQNSGLGFVPGGVITFGGGVALYQSGQIIGGLGVSGDTSCADHAIAYRMRQAAGLDVIPGGVNPAGGSKGNDNRTTRNLLAPRPQASSIRIASLRT